MRTPKELATWAAARYQGRFDRWAGSVALGADAALAYPLQPPTAERVVGQPDAAAAWVSQWQRWEAHGRAEVVWAERTWPALGRHRIPLRVLLPDAASVASVAGRRTHWDQVVRNAVAIRNRWPDAVALDAALTSTSRRLALLDDDDVDQLLAVVAWLVDHPGSGLHIRELPVPGMTTKWAEHHQDLCRALKAGITGDAELGLAKQRTRYRVRVLDERLRPSGLADFSAPAPELMRVPLAPVTVIVVENLTSVAAMPPLPGTVAVHGYGQAVGELADVGWLTRARVLYWGDLDTWGFRILSTLRQLLPHVESVLMDEEAIAAGMTMTVDPGQMFLADVAHLTAVESAALRRLRSEGLKIEQERLDWGYVRARLEEAVAGSREASGSTDQ